MVGFIFGIIRESCEIQRCSLRKWDSKESRGVILDAAPFSPSFGGLPIRGVIKVEASLLAIPSTGHKLCFSPWSENYIRGQC